MIEFRFEFHWNLIRGVQLTMASIGLANDLVPNRHQAITWTNTDPIHWRIYAVLGGDVFKDAMITKSQWSPSSFVTPRWYQNSFTASIEKLHTVDILSVYISKVHQMLGSNQCMKWTSSSVYLRRCRRGVAHAYTLKVTTRKFKYVGILLVCERLAKRVSVMR